MTDLSRAPSGQSPYHDVPPLLLPFSRRAHADLPLQLASVPVAVSSTPAGQLLFGSDPSLALLAAWFVLLWRFTDQSEVLVGYVGAHGVTKNAAPTLPLVVRFSGAMSFRDVVTQIEHARTETGFVTCEPLAFETFCPAMFCIGDESSAVATHTTRGRFQVLLQVRTDGASWRADLFYDAAALPLDAAQRLSRGLGVLLAAGITNPDSPADALPILNDEDRHQVTVTFNHTDAYYPADQCIHELFEQQAEAWPDRVALRDRTQSLTYRQLDERANRMAHFLRAKGAAPSLPVALYMDRCAEMIIGLLAILKSGACYLPLIPSDPQARVAEQIAQTKPPILLTAQRLTHSLPTYNGEVVLIDGAFEEQPFSRPESTTTPDDLVYILFTSGSTGVPKGVATRHRNLVNYTHFIRRQLEVENYPQGWHFATVSTLAADLGNTSIFGALTSGGCLHVIDYETAMNPSRFADYIAAHPIDLLKIAPSHLAALLRESDGRAVLPRHFVVVGGEKLTWELLRDIRDRSRCSVMNHYGPTETTVGCCTLIVKEESFSEWKPATIPLGRPIANDRVYILDRRMKPVPIGVAGELYMSGAGLSRGYFNQPERTAERFQRNPFSLDSSDRLYRSGDLARFLPDGTVEFLGRTDHQVKIRGFRVEPAELESALRRHAKVKQAVVVSEENHQGDRTLVAYVACSEVVGRDELRSFLAAQVPDYMLPARLTLLDSLPLNANGKIDLQALPELGKRADEGEKVFLSPANSDEEKLAAIWSEVLGLDRISRDDNFFSLGGHSLLATRIVSRIRKIFRVNFPLHALLENPTLRDCAARLGEFEHLTSMDEEDFTHLLREIGDMSEEEAERILASGEERSEDSSDRPAPTP